MPHRWHADDERSRAAWRHRRAADRRRLYSVLVARAASTRGARRGACVYATNPCRAGFEDVLPMPCSSTGIDSLRRRS